MTLCFEPRQSCTMQYNDTVLRLLYYCRLHFLAASCMFYSSGRISGRLVEKLLMGLEVKQRSIWLCKRMSFHSQAVYIKLQLFCFCVLYFCHGLLGDLARFRQEFRDTRERM
ncbi:uncharacterized protein B0J16DRAFT_341737 [Fusarium flagelliforme]|uniref:uncharacterized protein n=1 Tax=Fusarium flagelliforme TaxID=2675880 RepID=UPI001E8D1FAC|nr:uncharacterized protein B0J16DRAFT_341737 [Fusarium flagelliforme]KAH7185485.1 hypothetical protein B0J16DRAFT_341737 [Fusarium flagelliforme]